MLRHALIIGLLFSGIAMTSAGEVETGLPISDVSAYESVMAQAFSLQDDLDAVGSQADAMLRAHVNGTTGPGIYSLDVLWENLNGILESSNGLIEDVRNMIQTSDMKIGVIGDKLVDVVSQVQGDISKITASILLLSEDLRENINKVVPGIQVALGDLVGQLNGSINGVSAEIESAIKAFAKAGVEQIDIIGNDIDNILVTVRDSATGVATSVTTTIDTFRDDMRVYLGNMDARVGELFEMLKDAGVTQLINHVDEGLVNIMRTVDDGIRSFNDVITAKLDGIGDKVIDILEEVRLTMASVRETMATVSRTVNVVSDDVVTVAAGIRSLTQSTVGYFKDLEVEVVPMLSYGPTRLSAGQPRVYSLGGGASFIVRNVIPSDNRHFLNLGFDEIDGQLTGSALYGYRLADWFSVQGGMIRNRLGAGASFGNVYTPGRDLHSDGDMLVDKSNVAWEVGARFHGTSWGNSLDAIAQLGQRNGARVFGEFRDVTRDGLNNWRVGAGVGYTF